MSTIMDGLQHFTQDYPNGDGHLMVARTGQPLDRFEVTEVIREGTSLVLQCQPVKEMMPTIMEDFQHFTQDYPSGEGHLMVTFAGQPLDRFEVTEVIRQGTSLVLQCHPVEQGDDPKPLSFHDPRRFYEDLR